MKKSLLIVSLLVTGVQLRGMKHVEELHTYLDVAKSKYNAAKSKYDDHTLNRTQLRNAANNVLAAQETYCDKKAENASSIWRKAMDGLQDQVRKLESTNMSLQTTLQETEQKMKRAVTTIQKVQGKSLEDKRNLEAQSSELIKVGAGLKAANEEAQQKAQNDILKYAQQAQAAEKQLAEEQAKAKVQQQKLMDDNSAIMKELTAKGNVDQSEIMRLKSNADELRRLYSTLSDDLAEAKRLNANLSQQLSATQQKQPSALTRFLNWFRSKKSTTAAKPVQEFNPDEE